MTAKDANKKAKAAKDRAEKAKVTKLENDKKFKEILFKISGAADKGEFGIEFNENRKDYAEALKTLGYKVEFYDKNIMRINWNL